MKTLSEKSLSVLKKTFGGFFTIIEKFHQLHRMKKYNQRVRPKDSAKRFFLQNFFTETRGNDFENF